MAEPEALRLNVVMHPKLLFQALKAGSAALSRTVGPRAQFFNVLMMSVVLLLIGLVVLLASQFMNFDLSGISALAGALAGAVAGVSAVVIMQGSALKHVAHIIVQAGGCGGVSEIVIDRTGVAETSGLGSVHLAWRAYSEAVEFREGLILLFGAMLVVIPDAALPDGMDRENFRVLVGRFGGAQK